MSHDFQNEVTLTEEQYSCLVSRIASLEKQLEVLMYWANNMSRWNNVPPPV